MSEIIREEDSIITRVGATTVAVTPEKIILSVQQ